MHQLTVLKHVHARSLLTRAHCFVELFDVVGEVLRHGDSPVIQVEGRSIQVGRGSLTIFTDALDAGKLRACSPQLEVGHLSTLRLCQKTGDSSQTPILVGLVEFGRLDAARVQLMTELLKMSLVANGKMDKGRMTVSRTTVEISVLDSSVSCLYSLLRDREITVRDGIHVSFFVALLHLTFLLWLMKLFMDRYVGGFSTRANS
jgi:hypothetical protein